MGTLWRRTEHIFSDLGVCAEAAHKGFIGASWERDQLSQPHPSHGNVRESFSSVQSLWGVCCVSEPASRAVLSWLLSRVVLCDPLGFSCGSPSSGGILGTCVGPESWISGFETTNHSNQSVASWAVCCCHIELVITMARVDPGCFCSNNMYCPVIWLSLLSLCGTQLRDCGCTREINSLWASSPSPENLVERLKSWRSCWSQQVSQALGLARAGGWSLWGVCQACVSACLGKKALQAAKLSFLGRKGRQAWGNQGTRPSVCLGDKKNLLNAHRGTHGRFIRKQFVPCRAGAATASNGDELMDGQERRGWKVPPCKAAAGEKEPGLLSVSTHWPVGKREPDSSPCQWHLVDF